MLTPETTVHDALQCAGARAPLRDATRWRVRVARHP